ncbi:shufflon system plasmid conjugative transfer pilus tip adhesin PilV [Burkholderia vietnamiensis]|uniref:shufflon system plasmid conjugative transfer pilus tip adhesin PilV n=1 Tax=Burkholderia vietnamiensis TaxID=60552 RepID=UPI001594ACE0|nr:shufflon system plasmid conjugative transfer pilus tip adhesin PilV [Burkholderia vietnamiensis]MCA8270709.1 shufflon system plasmid conjugative transfer pilus tip adhesin PilV [Burkholderia vietnamiensis]
MKLTAPHLDHTGLNTMRVSRKFSTQRGFTSIEIMIGIAVISTFMVAAAGVLNYLNSYQTNKGVASDAQIVAQAANNWMTANIGAVVASANPSATYPLTTFAAYLPATFSAPNAYQQGYELRVFQSQPNQLDAIVVTTGGDTLSDGDAQQVAKMIGGAGGYVPSTQPQIAQGMSSGWKINWANFGGSPGAGHVAFALFVPNAGLTNGYLYRNAVPGHPELNKMNTAIDMGGNDVNNANAVNANYLQTTGGGQFTSDQGGSLELGGNNTKAGTGTPYIDFHLGGSGVQDFNTRVVNDSDGHLSVVGANGNASLKVQGTVQVGSIATPRTRCPGPGFFAANADGSGQSLECRYGQWMPIGGQQQFQAFFNVSNGSVVPAPVCPYGGIPQIQILPTNLTVNPTATVNFGPSGGTGPWWINITDGNGTPIAGTATAETFCGY